MTPDCADTAVEAASTLRTANDFFIFPTLSEKKESNPASIVANLARKIISAFLSSTGSGLCLDGLDIALFPLKKNVHSSERILLFLHYRTPDGFRVVYSYHIFSFFLFPLDSRFLQGTLDFPWKNRAYFSLQPVPHRLE